MAFSAEIATVFTASVYFPAFLCKNRLLDVNANKITKPVRYSCHNEYLTGFVLSNYYMKQRRLITLSKNKRVQSDQNRSPAGPPGPAIITEMDVRPFSECKPWFRFLRFLCF